MNVYNINIKQYYSIIPTYKYNNNNNIGTYLKSTWLPI